MDLWRRGRGADSIPVNIAITQGASTILTKIAPTRMLCICGFLGSAGALAALPTLLESLRRELSPFHFSLLPIALRCYRGKFRGIASGRRWGLPCDVIRWNYAD